MTRTLFALALLAGTAPAIADTIDFGQFGAVFSSSNSPVSGFTGDGVSFTLVGPSTFQRLDQGDGWSGQFTPGSKLLYSSQPGQFVFYFGAEISSLTDIALEINKAGNFTATATAYRFGAVVETSVRPGLSNPGGAGLLFPFVLDAAPFDTLTLTSTNDGSGFAVGSIAPVVVPGVPEPATWALMIGGFAMVGAAARRRRPATVTA